MKLEAASWIGPEKDMGSVCPVFWREFSCPKPVSKAEMWLTALGVYEARLNGQRVGDYVLAPGWTAYEKRLQYQQYDITTMIREDDNGDRWKRLASFPHGPGRHRGPNAATLRDYRCSPYSV